MSESLYKQTAEFQLQSDVCRVIAILDALEKIKAARESIVDTLEPQISKENESQ